MKGEKTISVNGKEYKVRFTLGAMEELQDHIEKDGFEGGTDQALQKMKYLRVFLSKMTKFAGNEVDADEFKQMDFSEVQSALSIVEESSKDVVGKGKAEK